MKTSIKLYLGYALYWLLTSNERMLYGMARNHGRRVYRKPNDLRGASIWIDSSRPPQGRDFMTWPEYKELWSKP